MSLSARRGLGECHASCAVDPARLRRSPLALSALASSFWGFLNLRGGAFGGGASWFAHPVNHCEGKGCGNEDYGSLDFNDEFVRPGVVRHPFFLRLPTLPDFRFGLADLLGGQSSLWVGFGWLHDVLLSGNRKGSPKAACVVGVIRP